MRFRGDDKQLMSTPCGAYLQLQAVNFGPMAKWTLGENEERKL